MQMTTSFMCCILRKRLPRIHTEGLVKEQVHVDITTDRLVIRITDAQDSTEELYTMDVLLHAPVDAVASRWTLLSTKVVLD